MNHCMPEAMAKRVGFEDLNIPANPPNKSPEIPTSNDVSKRVHVDDPRCVAIILTVMM